MIAGKASPAPLRWFVPVLGLLTGWAALFSWSGMVTAPSRYLIATLAIGSLVVALGLGLRRLGAPAYVVAGAQVLLTLLVLDTVTAGAEAWLGVVPTWASVKATAFAIYDGAAAMNYYAAPVSQNVSQTQAFLTACGMLVLLSIEALATWARRLPLVALPILVTLSVPITILDARLSPLVFITTALLFLRLLGLNGDPLTSTKSSPLLWTVSSAAVIAALLLAPLVPVTNLLGGAGAGGSGAGPGGSFSTTTVNPFIRLRRDLVEQTNTPMLYATTNSKDEDAGYLRTTVLDEYDGDSWRPSKRQLPPENNANGDFPAPPGLGPALGGRLADWDFEFAPGFGTNWLPLPYPVRSVKVPGVWRYDSRTLDVAFLGGGPRTGLSYSAIAFTPTTTSETLKDTVIAPASVRNAWTKLPANLPAVLTERAREVTRGAKGNYEKAVALQDWFRSKGGFEYSLDQREGSGNELLAAFVTDDRVGYCEQFAAAMATMGRILDIPSRVVVGFLDGTEEEDGRLLYTSDDRHAWPEMYFSGVGWVRFEPTPGQRTGASPTWTRQSADQTDPRVKPSPTLAPVPRSVPRDTASAESAASGSGWRIPWQPLAGLGVLVLLVLTPAGVRRGQRRRRLAGTDLHRLSEGAWEELRATALDLGLEWPEHRSPREQARSVIGQVPAAQEEVRSLKVLLTDVERGRYAGTTTTDADPDAHAVLRDRTTETVGSWRRQMQRSVDRKRSWRGRVLPASLLRRR
ncbi:MAG: DUF3488 and transglutaminase-like domain-containing protein [Marmoricola sp.]